MMFTDNGFGVCIISQTFHVDSKVTVLLTKWQENARRIQGEKHQYLMNFQKQSAQQTGENVENNHHNKPFVPDNISLYQGSL